MGEMEEFKLDKNDSGQDFEILRNLEVQEVQKYLQNKFNHRLKELEKKFVAFAEAEIAKSSKESDFARFMEEDICIFKQIGDQKSQQEVWKMIYLLNQNGENEYVSLVPDLLFDVFTSFFSKNKIKKKLKKNPKLASYKSQIEASNQNIIDSSNKMLNLMYISSSVNETASDNTRNYFLQSVWLLLVLIDNITNYGNKHAEWFLSGLAEEVFKTEHREKNALIDRLNDIRLRVFQIIDEKNLDEKFVKNEITEESMMPILAYLGYLEHNFAHFKKNGGDNRLDAVEWKINTTRSPFVLRLNAEQIIQFYRSRVDTAIKDENERIKNEANRKAHLKAAAAKNRIQPKKKKIELSEQTKCEIFNQKERDNAKNRLHEEIIRIIAESWHESRGFELTLTNKLENYLKKSPNANTG